MLEGGAAQLARKNQEQGVTMSIRIGRRATPSLLFSCLAILALSSCDTDHKVDVGLQDIEDGLEKLGKGIEGIDPVGLRELLAKNEALRSAIDDIKKQLSPLGSVGGVVEVSPTSRICFEISNYTGAYRIDAWVNTPDNWFLQNQVLPNNDFDLSFGLAQQWVDERNQQYLDHIKSLGKTPQGLANYLAERGDIWAFIDDVSNISSSSRALRAEIRASYQNIDKEYEQSFRNYIENVGTIPSGELAGCHNIDLRLKGEEFDHVVSFAITPLELDERGEWLLEYRTYLRRGEGDDVTEDRISSGRVDSKTTNGWKLGEPVTHEAGRFFVKIIGDEQ